MATVCVPRTQRPQECVKHVLRFLAARLTCRNAYRSGGHTLWCLGRDDMNDTDKMDRAEP